MNELLVNQLGLAMLISVVLMFAVVVLMFAVMIFAIYIDVRRHRAAEAAAAEAEAEEDESWQSMYEAELEDRYREEREHSEQYREWQAGGPAPSGRLSQF